MTLACFVIREPDWNKLEIISTQILWWAFLEMAFWPWFACYGVPLLDFVRLRGLNSAYTFSWFSSHGRQRAVDEGKGW